MSEVAKGMYKFTIAASRIDYGLCGMCAHANLREYGSEQQIICGAYMGANRLMPSPKRRVTSCSSFWEKNHILRRELPPWMQSDALYLVGVKPTKPGERIKVGLVTYEELNELEVKNRVIGFKSRG